MIKSGGKFVVGGGISGLIYAFYNPEFRIVSQNIGGMLSDGIIDDVFYVHASPMTEKLLKDLGIEPRKSTKLIRYFKGDVPIAELSRGEKVEVIRKKLMDPSFNPLDVRLSADDHYISALDVSKIELLERLNPPADRVIMEKVIRITRDEIVTEDSVHRYESLVSTIQAPLFWRLYKGKGLGFDLRGIPTTFVIADSAPAVLEAYEFNIAYFIDGHRYVRVSHADRSCMSRFLYEFPGDVAEDECLGELPAGSRIERRVVVRNNVIFDDARNVPPPGVLFVGRFARWDHSVRQHEVVVQSTYDCDFRMVWNRQMSFTSKFIDLNRLDDVMYQEETTKEMMLHLFPEVAELMESINYKVHKERKDVDVAALKMEIVDVFKYLLNVMIIWRIQPEELIRLFEEKSDAVEKKYESMVKRTEGRGDVT